MTAAARLGLALPVVAGLALAGVFAVSAGRGESRSDPAAHELAGIALLRKDPTPENLRRAQSHLTDALALRPGAARTWAAFAESRYLLGQTDALFEQALRNAARLGPNDPAVQALVAHYGLAVWGEVSGATREAIDHMVRAGMRRNTLEMLRIAQRRDRLDIACRHLGGVPRAADPKLSRFCPSMETPQ